MPQRRGESGARWRRRLAAAGCALVLVATLPTNSVDAAARGAGAACEQSDGLVRAREFMVAAAHPLAVFAGCRVLDRGGSAADAAVAVQAVLAVVEPQSSGLAGNTLAMVWDADTSEVRFFEGLARAPFTVTENLPTPTEEEKEELGIDVFPSEVGVTGRAVGVPGTMPTMEMLHDAYGALPWESLFDDAIDIAENGFPMPPYLHGVLGAVSSGLPFCAYPDIRARYCEGDDPKPVGTTIVNAELAEVLREIRDGGPDAFYDPDGTIAPAIVERATAGPLKPGHDEEGPAVIPSLMTLADVAGYVAVEREPLCKDLLRHTVCSSAPPAFGGITVLQMLAMLERGQVRRTSPRSPARYHLSIEASRLANFDRRQYVGHPDYHLVPVAGLLDDGSLDVRFSLFSRNAAIHPVEPGDPPGAPATAAVDAQSDSDMTSNVSIVDASGDAVSMTTTNNANFGANIEARGMVLNNAQTNFTTLTSISPGKPVNVMEPEKRPRTSMAPTVVLRRGRLALVVGAGGGGPIPDFVTQTTVGVLVDRMDPFTAVSQPHYSGQQITSNCSGVIGPPSELEGGTPAADLLPDLVSRGHPCARTATLLSGLTAIQVRSPHRLYGAADPRRDGTAMGR